MYIIIGKVSIAEQMNQLELLKIQLFLVKNINLNTYIHAKREKF